MALPPTATACGGVLDLDPLEDVVDAVADLADLGRRGRVGGDQLVGEDAGADLPGADLLDPAGDGAEDHLGRAAADVDDADLALDRVAEGLGRADEGEPPLLLLAEDVDRDPGGLGDRLRRPRSPLRRLADRRGGDRADRLGAELARASRTWVATTSPTSSIFSGTIAPVVVERLVDPRVGPLLHHLLQLPVDRLGDEHARRVGADIYRGAEHGPWIHVRRRSDKPPAEPSSHLWTLHRPCSRRPRIAERR